MEPIEAGAVLMTTNECAERLGVTRSTIVRYVQRGQLKPLELPQRGYLFWKWDIEALAARREAQQAPKDATQ